MGLAIITIHGNLGADAETKYLDDGNPITSFSVAVTDKRGKSERTAWYRCDFWGKRGENVAPYLTKGTPVVVSGRFSPREWETKEGEKRTSLDLDVNELSLAGSRQEEQQAPAPPEDDPPF